MSIRTQESMSGFIATDPELTFTQKGDARLYARVGQEHYRRNEDGTFTKLETTFHDLVAFRTTAERAHQQFAKGDQFVAEGYVRTYEKTVAGKAKQGEEFVAEKIGHDTTLTRYNVDRSRRDPKAHRQAEGPTESRQAVPPTPQDEAPQAGRQQRSAKLADMSAAPTKGTSGSAPVAL